MIIPIVLIVLLVWIVVWTCMMFAPLFKFYEEFCYSSSNED